jgi:hypothetical protein
MPGQRAWIGVVLDRLGLAWLTGGLPVVPVERLDMPKSHGSLGPEGSRRGQTGPVQFRPVRRSVVIGDAEGHRTCLAAGRLCVRACREVGHRWRGVCPAIDDAAALVRGWGGFPAWVENGYTGA